MKPLNKPILDPWYKQTIAHKHSSVSLFCVQRSAFRMGARLATFKKLLEYH